MNLGNRQFSKGTGEIYSVSQLNREVRSILEGNFPMLWVEGEISNLAKPASGHLYFSLKDSNSQVRCAMFRGKNNLLKFQPENGMQVMLYARVSLYEGRGEFQLIAERMEPAGEGALQLAFEQLKRRLEQEGLFDSDNKKSLPEFPQTVGVVTSSSGAALRDILHVLRRRFPALNVIIYPTQVQGEQAGHTIARAINLASERQECDSLIISRGGGSLEDLWAFNEEVVARAIHGCSIPVISGVGHETDFTIADFVADLRAPTPSAAAEMISYDQTDLKRQLEGYRFWLIEYMENMLAQLQQATDWLEKRLVHPGQHLQTLGQRIQELDYRLETAMLSMLDKRRIRLGDLVDDLKQYNPAEKVGTRIERCHQLKTRLGMAMQRRLEVSRSRLVTAMRTLNTVSPLATLERGYAVVQKQTGEKIVRRYSDVQPGEMVEARLGEGSLECLVERCKKPRHE